jgi:hypothetical protein
MNKRKGFILIAVCCAISLSARDLRREISLRVGWRFEIGDNMVYAEPGFNDSDWERIHVSDNWEDQGFPGYDGYAWYRIRFKISDRLAKKSLYLKLGYIDDVDAAYINGRYLNGSGSFPPEYQTAYDHERIYHLPHEDLLFDQENVIAVRVYDETLDGGFVRGDVGIFSYPSILLEMDLAGTWKFSPGDSPDWSRIEYNDADWESMHVPGNWENQGYPYHDGYGWYRKEFLFPDSLESERLILALGLIDDSDEVYFNGTRIGRTGTFPGEGQGSFFGNSWQKDRFYMIPPHLIRWNTKNLIAVRVYDYQGPGGIYDGPIGLTDKETYLKYRRNRKPYENWLERLLRNWD